MDWIDILLHAIGGLAIVGIVGLWNLPAAFGFNTGFWITREFLQHMNNLWAPITHPQSLLEWLVPVLVGCLVFYVYHEEKHA